MLGLACTVSLFGFPYIILLPAVARDALGLGPDGLGLMMSAVGLGAVVGGLGLAAFGDVPRKALLAVVAGAILALLLVAFSLASTLRAATPLLFFLGMVQVNCVASINTTLQVKVADDMRGRVMSMRSFALFGLSTLGSVLLGMVGDRVGIASASAWAASSSSRSSPSLRFARQRFFSRSTSRAARDPEGESVFDNHFDSPVLRAARWVVAAAGVLVRSDRILFAESACVKLARAHAVALEPAAHGIGTLL
jgi:MFS family permease